VLRTPRCAWSGWHKLSPSRSPCWECRGQASRLVASLAARLAWRITAVAPWLCVPAFRLVCSEQRPNVYDSPRQPPGQRSYPTWGKHIKCLLDKPICGRGGRGAVVSKGQGLEPQFRVGATNCTVTGGLHVAVPISGGQFRVHAPPSHAPPGECPRPFSSVRTAISAPLTPRETNNAAAKALALGIRVTRGASSDSGGSTGAGSHRSKGCSGIRPAPAPA
jgi:hypothetical protein